MRVLFLLIVAVLSSCSTDFAGSSFYNPPLFQLLTSDETGIDFSNKLYESEELNIITFEYLYNGAGVGVIDVNNDGLQDLYFSGNMVSGKLYLNQGGLRFEDITAKAGIDTQQKWGTGVSVVDINDDGYLDLYLCFAGPYGPDQRRNELYVNNGDLTFTEQAAQYGLDARRHTTQAAFFDYDRDGDLDVYLLNNITDETGPNIIRPKRVNGEMPNTDQLLRNDGGRYVDVSASVGILKEGYGLGVALGDINDDGWPDVFVSNDYLSNDLLYINNQDGTFTDQAESYLHHTSYSSMGCDLADYNNDGRPDIVALDMLPPDNKRRKLMIGSINYNRFRSELQYGYFPQFMRNTLQLNQGPMPDGHTGFGEIGLLAGIEATDWSWSPLFEDVDNDGFKDLLITNGYPRDITNRDFASYKADLMKKEGYDPKTLKSLIEGVNKVAGAYLPNFAFQNNGDMTFSDLSDQWGFTQPSFSHGATVADLDNDGDLDYITNNSYDEVFVYENRSTINRSFRVTLDGPAGNPQGIGAKLWLYQKDQVQYREFYPQRGYLSSLEPVVHFGIGTQDIDSLVVLWPDGKSATHSHLTTSLRISLAYGNAQSAPQKPKEVKPLLTATAVTDYVHQEKAFNDFDIMTIRPRKHSQEGPRVTKGDVNGDGLMDVFIGGAVGQVGKVVLQDMEGRFTTRDLHAEHALYEDTGCLFVDVDGDGDQDLYVASGSNEFRDSSYYQDRVYINDGKGNFQYEPDRLPPMGTSTTAIAASDFDRDGDWDLFVGGRIVPGRYPERPRSYLLENREGMLVDVTHERSPELLNYGMITDARWLDTHGDGWEDLVVVGEWLPLSIFSNDRGRSLLNTTAAAGLEETIGWWNRLAVADLDGDGDQDLVAGNLGLNTHYRSTKEEPLTLVVADFDQNDQLDPIMVHHLQDRRVPMHFRDDLLAWLLPLKKQFLDYESYAEADWSSFFEEVAVEQTDVHTFATSWVENMGDGTFVQKDLPLEAQIAPVYGIATEDINDDGHIDLLLVGNSNASNPFDGHYDAMPGLVLKGSSDGTFEALSVQESGFYVPGEGRDIMSCTTADGKRVIVAVQSNGPALTFELREMEGTVAEREEVL